MSDYKSSNLVVQSNQFIRETYNNLKAMEIKVFDTLVSCIDTQHPKTKIEIKKSELAKAVGMQADTNYVYVANSLKALLHETWSYTTEEYVILRNFLQNVKWWYHEDRVEIEFHKDVIPMLIDLKNNFLTFSPLDLKDLKSRYSMVLYKYVLSYARQYKTKKIPIEMSELRKVLNLKNKYKDFKFFRVNVLDVFVKEINSSNYLPYLVTYAKLVENRKVKTIIFTIRERTSNSEHYFSDVRNGLIAEQEENKLLKLGKSEEEIHQHQADAILSKPLEQQIEEAKKAQEESDPFN